MKTGKFSGCLFFFLFITIGRGRVSEKKTAQLSSALGSVFLLNR